MTERPDTACPICARREPADGLVACRRCLDRIDDDLARIAELTRLAAMWTEARRGTQEPTSRPVAGSRPPLDIGALDGALGLAGGIVDVAAQDRRQADDIGGSGRPAWLRPAVDTTRDTLAQQAPVVLDALESWVRLTREEAGLVPWGIATEGRAVTVATLVAFLRSWLAWIAERPDYPVDDLAREVSTMRWQLEHLDPANNGAEPGSRLQCPADHPDADGRLCHATIRYDRQRPGDDIHCPRCRTVWSAARLLLVALNDETQAIWMYPAEVESLIGIPKRTLQRWGQDGTVGRRGTQYDVGAAFRTRIRVGA